MLNSVFGVLYLKKIPALEFQKELIEMPCRLKEGGTPFLADRASVADPISAGVYKNQFAIYILGH